MRIIIDTVIEKYGMGYNTVASLEAEGRKEISFEDAMCLDERGIIIDEEQDIYTGDLPREERKSNLLRIFK